MSPAMTRGQAMLPIAPEHPAYAGHFPGMPILPGVVLLDEALHAVGALIGADLSACELGSVKFLSAVRPGEPLAVRHEMQHSGTIRFDIFSGERKVASGAIRTACAG